MIMEDQV